MHNLTFGTAAEKRQRCLSVWLGDGDSLKALYQTLDGMNYYRRDTYRYK